MKVQELFDAYEDLKSRTKNIHTAFERSGMTDCYDKLDFGFFPVGSGRLCGKSKIAEAEIEPEGVMVLGNDFGTVKYRRENCKNDRESNSRTIDNLVKAGIDLDRTFFTNFYMGLRDDTMHPKMTMTKLAVGRSDEYKKFCFEYFIMQLKLIQPSLVICIGKEVGNVLSEKCPAFFEKWRSVNFKKLYNTSDLQQYIVKTSGNALGERDFMFIPHPSYAHVNWKKHQIKEKLNAAFANG